MTELKEEYPMPPFEPVYFSYDLLDRLIFILRYKWFFVLFLTLGLTAGLLSAVQAWRAVQMSSHNMQEKTEIAELQASIRELRKEVYARLPPESRINLERLDRIEYESM